MHDHGNIEIQKHGTHSINYGQGSMTYKLHLFSKAWRDQEERNWPFDIRKGRALHSRVERGLDAQNPDTPHVGDHQQRHRWCHL